MVSRLGSPRVFCDGAGRADVFKTVPDAFSEADYPQTTGSLAALSLKGVGA